MEPIFSLMVLKSFTTRGLLLPMAGIADSHISLGDALRPGNIGVVKLQADTTAPLARTGQSDVNGAPGACSVRLWQVESRQSRHKAGLPPAD